MKYMMTYLSDGRCDNRHLGTSDIHSGKRFTVTLARKRKNTNSDDGFTLIELMVSMVIIVIVLLASAAVFVLALGIQQDIESSNKANQVARDYIERSKQASYNTLGFYNTDDSFRVSAPNGEQTVVIPGNKQKSGLVPLDTKTVGGVIYQVRIDITTTDPGYAYAPKRVIVEVSWTDGKNESDSSLMSVVRSPNASEQIPPALDLSVAPGNGGVPSSPSYYDAINKYAGTASTVLGHEFVVKVAAVGSSPVSDLKFSIVCGANPAYVVSWASPPVGWTKSVSGNTYYLGYYTKPATITCEIENATTTAVAHNNSGDSSPMTILTTNFLRY